MCTVPEVRNTPGRAVLRAALVLPLMAGSMAAADPVFPEIPGWRLNGLPVVYTPANLWDFIDGAAELYLIYGFNELQVGEYRRGDGVEVRAELYRHLDAASAFGIYASERSAELAAVAAGGEGYEAEGILNFVEDRFYVKLSTQAKRPLSEAVLREVASHIDTHLGSRNSLPEGLLRLPEAGRRRRTEGYVPGSFLGYPFLRSAFTARYGEGEGTLLYVMDYATEAEASEAMAKYLATVPGSAIRPGRYRISDPGSGAVTMLQRGRFLAGTVGAPDPAAEQTYLDLLERSVR